MFIFEEIEAHIPDNGFLTVSFTKKAPGVIRVICAPTYTGLNAANTKVVNVAKPVIVTVSDPRAALDRINAIVEEAKARYNHVTQSSTTSVAKGQATKKGQPIAEPKIGNADAAAAVENLVTEDQHLPGAYQSTAGTPTSRKQSKEISLSAAEIAYLPKLPEKQRLILQLRVIEKKSAAAVAVALNISPAGVYVRQNAALKKLKQLLITED